MKNLGVLIKKQIETRQLVKKTVAKQVGISPTYLSTLFNQETMDCLMFERICHAIGLNPAIAFDDAPSSSQVLSDIHANTLIGPATVTIGETKALQDLLAEKERMIQVLLAASGINLGTGTGQVK